MSSQPITILIAALGGEGGGVLAEWLVELALRAGHPAQATSIPGVAQRTGATTYYVEIHPQTQAELGGRAPVMSLSPVDGRRLALSADGVVVSNASGGLFSATIDPYQFSISATTHPQHTPAEVEAAVEEAVANALVNNTSVTGRDGHRSPALPHDLVRARASFVEWRAHVSLRDVPKGGVHIDGSLLARGAKSAQDQGLMPVLTVAMPDLGTSSAGVTQAVTTNALLSLFEELVKAEVESSQLLLRVNMVVAGVAHHSPTEPGLVADMTMTMLERCLPHHIGGVLLLSGGQSLEGACTNLAAVCALAAERLDPWPLSFGFSRPLVSAAAEVFSDEADDQTEASRVLMDSARLASEALATSFVTNGTPV